jgi:type II secretory pathway pseudopilin PulG
MRRRLGFSLMEMVVTLVVLGMVTFFLTELLVRQSRTYTVVDDVSEAQQNLRAVTGLIERELRMTGFMVPEAAVVCGWDMPAAAGSDQTPDVLYVTDAEAIEPEDRSSAELQGASVIAGFTGSGVDAISVSSFVVDDDAFYDLDGDGIGDSDFLYSAAPERNGGVIIADRNNPDRGASCGVITDLDPATNTIEVDFDVLTPPHAPAAPGAADGGTPLAALPGGATADLIAIPAHVYWVNPGPPPQLIRDGMVLANDIEDLQIAFFYDGDGDGDIDPGEYRGTVSGLGAPYVYQSSAEDNRELREVQVTVVARTRSEDPDVLVNPALANSVTQAAGNRQAGAVADGFRRRAVTLNVRPRNVNRLD